MKTFKSLKWAALAVLLGTAVAGPALAQHGHGYYHGGGARFGVVIGAPWNPWYYPAPYYANPYYYSPPVVIERPPVYVEQAPAAAPASEPSNFWYYCEGSRTYYPYVHECPGGWQRTAPRPPSPGPR